MARNLDFYRDRPVITEIMGLSKVRRMPRIGKIHLGIKVPSGKNAECKKKNHPTEAMCAYCSFPKDADYFVFQPDLDPRLKAKVLEVYGPTPQTLDIYFPTNNREQFFPQALMWYKGARLICKGDGEQATRIDEATGHMRPIACPCEHFTQAKPDCKARGKLLVMLPRITMAGVWQIDTGSTNNMIDINSACDYYRKLLYRLAFVPFLLRRVPTQIMTPDGKPVTKSLLRLEFEGDESQVAAFRERDAIAALGPAGKAMSAAAALPPAPDFDEIEEDPYVIEVTGGAEDMPIPDALEEIPPGVDEVTGEVLSETIGHGSAPPLVDHETEQPFGETTPPKNDPRAGVQEAVEAHAAANGNGGQKTNNFEFLQAAGALKLKVGEATYYQILGGIGFEKSSHILDKAVQEQFLSELRAAAAPEMREPGADEDQDDPPTTQGDIDPYLRGATSLELLDERWKACFPVLNSIADNKFKIAMNRLKTEIATSFRRSA